MTPLIKNIFLNLFPLNYLRTLRRERKVRQELEKWEKCGKPNPPPHIVKQRNLIHFAKTYNLKTFIETGTFNGDMVEALKNYFDEIYSIELSKDLFEKANIRFKSQKNVTIIHGDSGKELKTILKNINRPTLFWLDGHYSGGETALGEKDTPVIEELHCILESKELQHVLIIDDARLFGTDSSYPTIEELSDLVCLKWKNIQITVEDDSIRITPKR